MRFGIGYLLASVLLPGSVVALPSQVDSRDDVPAHIRGKRSFYTRDGVKRTVFEHEATGAKLDFVTNSGICETTPGVNQYSGYISVGSELPPRSDDSLLIEEIGNENMWFWFFEARHNASTAPLATWFNGGPGCSSMIGLFQV
jgi:carboxypeptidase C (cathepsin A)